MIQKIPIIKNPELLDKIIGNIQLGLKSNLTWLDYAFGRAERITKQGRDRKKIQFPSVYAGGNEYIDVSPDSNIGNFCFFYVDDPQEVDWTPKMAIGITTKFSLIFWLDYRRIYDDANIRNKEALKKEILDCLNGGFHVKAGRVTINRIYEEAANIYKEFTIDEIDNQFLMHPYGGFRFDGELMIKESCIL